MKAPVESRLGRLRRHMEAQGLACCMLSGPESMRYYSGFGAITYTRPIRLIVTPDRTCLIVPALEEAHACGEGVRADEVKVYYEHPPLAEERPGAFRLICRALGAAGARVGVEENVISLREAGQLRDQGYEPVPVAGFLRRERAIKDEYEKACIREAGRLCRYAMAASLEHAREGISELELEEAGSSALYKMISGDDYPWVFSSPTCFTASGPERSVMPHVFSGMRTLRGGDMVIHVRKPAINGYHAELERTFVLGRPEPEVLRAFSAMAEAQQAILARIRPGVTGREMDALARGVLEKYGYGAYAIHRSGHGQGLGRHEEPFLIFDNEEPLEEGMVLTVEPGIYVPGLGGFRHSDTLILTADGYENVTEFERAPEKLVFA